jgi:hypothetical protein
MGAEKVSGFRPNGAKGPTDQHLPLKVRTTETFRNLGLLTANATSKI